ncbi:hypothetical protein [Streptosporangium sp. NPDC001681]|uniref:hypothetical protein n=1 Tax=Streptosporangium sp. NPDC001681 TaxID=3154395 RepID=UPI003321E504
MSSEFFIPAPEGQVPSAEGYFGAFGGKFIPEVLVATVDEVAVEYEKAKADPAFVAEFEDLLVNYTGRPSALAGALEVGKELGKDGLIIVNLSGRGDKDMDTAARYFGLHDAAEGESK